MAIIKNPITVINKGSDIVNGIIEEYKATTSTIDANTFVEFVNSINSTTDAKLSNTIYGGQGPSAVMLDANHVFIAHNGAGDTTLSSDSRLYGVVCTISGTTITAGTDKRISTMNYSGVSPSVTAIDANHVFIAHNGGTSPGNTSSRLYGVVCTISGTTITAGTDTQLSTTNYGGLHPVAAKLDSSTVFVTHSGYAEVTSKDCRVYGIVCTISGTTITAGTDTYLTVGHFRGSARSSVAVLDPTHVVVVYGESSSTSTRNYNILMVMVCTISGSTITKDTAATLAQSSGGYVGYGFSVTAIDSTTIFVAHTFGTSTSDLVPYGIICTISGTTITAGTDTQLSESKITTVSAAMVDSSNVGVVCDGEEYCFVVICQFSSTKIESCTDVQLSNDPYSNVGRPVATSIGNGMIFAAHSGEASYRDAGSRLYGATCFIEKTVVQSTNVIKGLTKTACTESEAGEVWVLNN